MPKPIRTWQELFSCSTDTYMIVPSDPYGTSAWITPKIETNDTTERYFETHAYLSTHTFYQGHASYYTKVLQKFGFDVEIVSWPDS